MYRTIAAFLLAPLLCVSAARPSCVRLSWTAPGDDNYVGRATVYDLRYSTDSAYLVNNFSSAPQVQGMIGPRVAGTHEEFVVAGLTTGVRYFFAIKTADERSNWSPISNVIRKTASGDSCSTPTACMRIRAANVNPARQGQHNYMDIMLDYSNRAVGGFDLLFGYDYNAYTVADVRPGNLYGSCGWEYFNYWLESTAGCSGCPAGLLRVRAAPELNNGSVYPACSLEGMVGSIVRLDFLIGTDPTLECRFLPVNLFWLDCDDNVFVSSDGAAQWLSREVYDPNLVKITDPNEGFPDDEGAPNSCLAYVVGEPAPSRCVDFTSGGLNVACGSDNQSRGDINLNGQAYEISDAVVFGNYFINGMSAFENNPTAQAAASDINGDGLILTVVDLVHLIRIVTGDASPIPKSIPGGAAHAELAYHDGVLMVVSTDTPIGAVHLVVEGEVTPELDPSLAGLDLQYHFDGSVTRVLVWDLDGSSQIDVGPLLRLSEKPNIRKLELAGFNMTVMSARFDMLPDRLTLSQNAPNPFNPTTQIRFALPEAGKVTLAIYNVMGQRVTTLVDGPMAAGYHTVSWDARKFASGVYLYRLSSGDLSESRKMVLLK